MGKNDFLISRQAVLAVIYGMHVDGEDGVTKALPNTYGADLREIIEQIYNLPSAQPEIIRCKDCKYMTEHYDTDGNAPYWTCSEWDSGTDYDGFCHYAERRSDE